MAKKSTIEKNERRKQMAARQFTKRQALADTVRSTKATDEEKRAAQVAFSRNTTSHRPLAWACSSVSRRCRAS